MKVVAIRHPMPYGDLAKQACQRFASLTDLELSTNARSKKWKNTSRISARGQVIYAGVDYEMILRQAEKEADVIVWDGGNNDMSFYQPDL